MIMMNTFLLFHTALIRQIELCDDVIGAVLAFASSYSPPLVPAFDKTFDLTLSTGNMQPLPPAYNQSETALQVCACMLVV